MKTYKEIFASVPEEKLISAVRNGMNVYLRKYKNKYGYDYETFFGAAVRYGTPALVHACIDMGADVNCVAPIKAQGTSPRAVTSSLVAAMNEHNAPALRALLERGARTGVLNGLLWDTQKNIFPESLKNADDENAKKIKQRLDAGTEILKILREFGFKVPGLGDYEDEDMSLHYVYPLHSLGSGSDKKEEIAGEKYTAWEDWYEEYADGGDDGEDRYDRFCEGMDEWHPGEFSFPTLGTRPGALWHAVSPEALKLMINEGADVNAMGTNVLDASGWTAMHHFAYSCCNCDIYFNPGAMLQILIDSGADINARGRYGMTPLMLAGMNVRHHPKALETVKFLLRNGADFDAEDESGRGVWYWMRDYWHGNGFEKRILNEILFEVYGFAQPGKAKTAEGEPVLSALSSADIDLMTAAFWGTADDIAPILARGANVNARTRHGFTVLMFSSVWNYAPASKFLIEHGAELDAKNDQKSTALMLAMQTMDLPMIEALLEAGPNLREATGFGRTPLMTLVNNPCCSNMGDLVKKLIDAGADVNTKDDNGLTTLMHVASHSKPDIDVARVLIGAGADVNARGNDGCTALEIALNEASKWSKPGDFVKFLLSNGANPRLMPIERTQIDGESEWRMAEILRRFDLKPCRSFKDVFACNSAEAVTAAVKSGLDLSLEDGGETFFDAVLRYGAPETVQACVDRGVDVNEQWSGSGIVTYQMFPESWPLYKAIAAHNAGAVEVLLKAGAYIGITENLYWIERVNIFPEGDAADAIAAKADEAAKVFKDRLDAGAKILKMLREAGASVPYSDGEELTYTNVIGHGTNWPDKADAVTELRRAVSPKAMKLLIDAGADVNAKDDEGRTAMYFIARDWNEYFKPYSIMKILIGAGADFGVKRRIRIRNHIVKHYPGLPKTLRLKILDSLLKAYTADCRETEVFTAAAWGSVLEIESALSAGADVNATDDKGYTPLMFASAFNNVKAVEYLISKGAKVDAENGQRETAISLAMKAGSAVLVKVLSGAGVNVNIRGVNGGSLLSSAGSEESAIALIKAGADVNAKNENGDAALKEAMRMSRFKIARALLAAGADPKCILDDEGEGAAENKSEPENERDEDKKDNNDDFTASLRRFGLEV